MDNSTTTVSSLLLLTVSLTDYCLMKPARIKSKGLVVPSHALSLKRLVALKKAARRVSASNAPQRASNAREAFGFLQASAAAQVVRWPEL